MRISSKPIERNGLQPLVRREHNPTASSRFTSLLMIAASLIGGPLITSATAQKDSLPSTDTAASQRKWHIVDVGNEGILRAKQGDKYGFVQSGKIVIPFQYKWASAFHEGGIAIVKNEKGLYGCINRSGKVIEKMKWTSMDPFKASRMINNQTKEEFDALQTRTETKVGEDDHESKLIIPFNSDSSEEVIRGDLEESSPSFGQLHEQLAIHEEREKTEDRWDLEIKTAQLGEIEIQKAKAKGEQPQTNSWDWSYLRLQAAISIIKEEAINWSEKPNENQILGMAVSKLERPPTKAE